MYSVASKHVQSQMAPSSGARQAMERSEGMGVVLKGVVGTGANRESATQSK